MSWTKEQIEANRAKWLQDLRSGDFSQGNGLLCSNKQFCCLGIAMNFLGDLEDWSQKNINGTTMLSRSNSPESLASVLPGPYKQALGIDNVLQSLLIELNDTRKESFSFIADFLEARFEKEYRL